MGVYSSSLDISLSGWEELLAGIVLYFSLFVRYYFFYGLLFNHPSPKKKKKSLGTQDYFSNVSLIDFLFSSGRIWTVAEERRRCKKKVNSVFL